MKEIKTLGDLKASGYKYRPIKDELRGNLIKKIKAGKEIFPGIHGFDDTVLPDMKRAFLSRHNILLLGLRGQAKTRIARLSVNLLDDHVPVIKGSELNEDPLMPLTTTSKQMLADMKDDLPIEWLPKSQRFIEKLATPDVSMADLIGDIDPIKAATNKWSFADERSIHFGLVPRSNRCIFIINELPDLQPRIQVALLNILQEGDLQIRGYKLRMPLDIQLIFTANPEDYTNRGTIITPLKDRIDSQILTHYPDQIEIAKRITLQEAKIDAQVKKHVFLSSYAHDIIERISFVARENEYIDEQSGVSARLSISSLENLYSSAELRMLSSGQKETGIRVIDFIGVIPSVTGKVELLYEGEQEGPYNIALSLIGEAIKDEFLVLFPDPDQKESRKQTDPYHAIKNWFSNHKSIEIWYHEDDDTAYDKLSAIDGLKDLVLEHVRNKKEATLLMEIVLYGLAEMNILSRELLDDKVKFSDSLADIIDDLLNDDDFDEEDY
jgi:magnesium chelatase subunit I